MFFVHCSFGIGEGFPYDGSTKAFSAGKVGGGNVASHRGDSLDRKTPDGIFTVPVTYIYHESHQPNVGKYTVHGPYEL